MKQIISVVLTGGPCAGKSNSIVELKEFLSDLVYKVIIIPEIATKIKSDGFIRIIEKIFKRYTAVFHLESTAVGNAEFYSKVSNEYRLAAPEYARKLENRGIEVWKSHPNFHIINVEEIFEIKLEKIKKAILDLLNVYKYKIG